MSISRKKFIKITAGTTAAGLFSPLSYGNGLKGKNPDELPNMTADAKPISKEERGKRITKAQQLLAENQLEALILDCGSSLLYFTGISWWPSERPMLAIIPVNGEISYVCPAFEEGRLKEMITIGNKIYTWEEDESPYERVLEALESAGIRSGKIAMEESLRFFILDGIRKAAPDFEYVGDPVTKSCRLIKSDAEIALMQKATNITMEAIKTGISQLREGMSQHDVSGIIASAHGRMGAVHDFALVCFAQASASPHGSILPQELKKGDIVLFDCGCRVHGYSSDVSRTIVFGAKPTKRQLEIWNLEKKAQAAGFAAVKLGATCESVDAASRKVITDAGFGPGYQLPGLPHRTGHGIGMDGHEWGYIVKGNKQELQPGMCFSIEPTIAIPGEFGVRLEDCVYMTEEGPKWFSQPSPDIERPFG